MNAFIAHSKSISVIPLFMTKHHLRNIIVSVRFNANEIWEPKHFNWIARTMILQHSHFFCSEPHGHRFVLLVV